MKRIILTSVACLFAGVLYAQLATNEQPYGLKEKDTMLRQQSTIVLPLPNRAKIDAEDSAKDCQSCGLRYAYPVHVDYTLDNSGQWQQLPDGGRLWRLKVSIPGALSTNTYYDTFYIPQGGKFFVYSEDTKQSIGAITSEFLNSSRANPIRFATALIYGETVVYEYYQPALVKEPPLIHINRIDYGYRYVYNPYQEQQRGNIGGFDSAWKCHININCPDGDDWQLEKRAAARISTVTPNGSSWCSGALINNTREDYTPYFLTANHCTENGTHDSYFSQWVFYWDYEHPNCSNSSTEPIHKTTTGATWKARDTYYLSYPPTSDFLLLLLTQDPRSINGFSPYYLGWDRSGNAGKGGVGIHHPYGDVKKIATYIITPKTASNCWAVSWYNGLVQGGSSGSPLLNSDHRVIGQLWTSSATLSCNDLTGMSNYGKISLSWEGNTHSPVPSMRLRDWLDPDNTGVMVLDGLGICTYPTSRDLMIKDNVADIGQEPNLSTKEFWNSPSIWVRHNNDKGTTHQDPKGGYTNYVYVKIHNLDNFLSSYGTEKLYIHWSKASTNMPWSGSWWGDTFPTGQLCGDLIDSVLIPVIPPKDSVILEIPWQVPDPADYYSVNERLASHWHFCLLGRIPSGMSCPESRNTGTNAKINNNIAQKNVSVIETAAAPSKILACVLMGNSSASPSVFSIGLTNDDDSKGLNKEAEITVTLDHIIHQAWIKGGLQCINIEPISMEERTFLVKGANAKLQNLIFEPYEEGLISLQFNFLTREMTDQINYTCHVVQIEEEDGDEKIIGGETYAIIKSPRVPFYAQADDIYAFVNDPITLTAANIGEPAVYRWYDMSGNLVCEEEEFETVANHEKQYKLEVIALSDGYKDYATAKVKIVPGKIEEIFPNPTDNDITVVCVFNSPHAAIAAEAYIQVSDYMGMVYDEFSLIDSPAMVSFSTQNYPIGTYVVRLFCNGQVADVKTFVRH